MKSNSDSPAPSSVYPEYPRVGVGAVVLKDNKALMVKRGQPPSSGLWAIPGGCVELGETLQEAAEREIYEETGIVIKAGEPVLTFDYIERDETGRIIFHYVIIDLKAEYISGTPRPADDALDARWISAQEMDELPVNSKTRNLLTRIFYDKTY